MNIKYILIILVCLVMSNEAFAAGKNFVILDRAKLAKEEFQKLVVNDPNKEIEATIYFIDQIAIGEMQRILKQRKFEILGFKHYTQYSSGGYNLRPGESLEEALANYERDHVTFLKKRLEFGESIISNNDVDEPFQKAVTKHQNVTQYMIDKFSNNGLHLVGIDVKGMVITLNDFMNEHAIVRLVEERRKGDKKPVMIPNLTK